MMVFGLNSAVIGLSLFVAVLTSMLLLLRMYARYKLSYWNRRGVEQLSSVDLIFGNFRDAFLFRTGPGAHLAVLHRAASTDAPYLGFYIFHKPCILLRDPESIKQIMIRDFENFSDRHFGGSVQKDSFGMKNLFGLKNPAWKYLRSRIAPTLRPAKLRAMFPLMIEIGVPMMDFLRSRREDERGARIVDAQELSCRYATDLIATVALGTKMDSFGHPNAEFTKAVGEFFHGFKRMVALVTVFFMPELVELVGSTVLVSSKFVRKLFWKAIDKREKEGFKRGDFIDSLIQLKNGEQNDVYKFEGDNLFYQSGSFFSGFESSSTTASFTLMELANNPEYQSRVRDDVEKSIEKHGLTCEAFSDMKYLDQALAEGIRLHPPVTTIDRYTHDDYTVPGTDVVLEKGTPVYISVYGLQKDPRFFDQPEVYNPDRFADGVKVSDAYIPFGIGPRMCVAMKLGQLHAKIVIAMVLREYEISQQAKNESVQDSRSTLTAAADGILLDFKKISRR